MLGISNLKKTLVGVLALNIGSSLAGDVIPWSENKFYVSMQGCNGLNGFAAEDLVDGFNVNVYEYEGSDGAGDYADFGFYASRYSLDATTYYASNTGLTNIYASISTMDYYFAYADIYGMSNIDISKVAFEFTGFIFIEEPGVYLVHVPAVDTGVAVYIGASNAGMSCCGDIGVGTNDYTVIVTRIDERIPAYGTGAQYLDKGYYPIKIVAVNRFHNYILDVMIQLLG
ncbi:hypothetical protein B5S31_g5364 [[Candida] boidinii]|nr:hypothetical protein B5S31_g5364 [[Candida] boidinii]